MRSRGGICQELDPFDTLADVDGFDGFFLEDEGTDPEDTWFRSNMSDDPFCKLGLGDSDGLCVRDTCGCHYEGCIHASPNDF